MEIRRRHIFTLTLAAIVAIAIPAIFAIAPLARAADGPTANASIVHVANYRAARTKIVHRKFRPWAHPTAAQVREIIRNESHRWHISPAALSNRVACESRYHWWASNGQYQGLLQFGANAFYRGLSTMRTHKIRLVRTKARRVHDARVTQYSDGHSVRRRTTPRRQRVIVVLSARIPRRPSMTNPFAQLRIGAQAIRGISAVRSSEWACAA
jgi:hypothetical protein